jgi:hypothetical protein
MQVDKRNLAAAALVKRVKSSCSTEEHLRSMANGKSSSAQHLLQPDEVAGGNDVNGAALVRFKAAGCPTFKALIVLMRDVACGLTCHSSPFSVIPREFPEAYISLGTLAGVNLPCSSTVQSVKLVPRSCFALPMPFPLSPGKL